MARRSWCTPPVAPKCLIYQGILSDGGSGLNYQQTVKTRKPAESRDASSFSIALKSP